MDSIVLGSPILDQGIRTVNFFNGRLLTSKDLGREQDARRQADARLGKALGPGIAWGLEVTRAGDPKSRTVQIKAGLAVAGSGQALYLANDQMVSLTEQASAVSLAVGGNTFAPCGVLSGSPYVAGDGLYLLTLAPSSHPEGKAEVLALDPGNVRCNTDALVEAVQLRLLKIDTSLQDDGSLDTNVLGANAISRLRNNTAYACFGYPSLSEAHVRPGLEPAASLLDKMRDRTFTDCDVPVAVVYITESNGIVFVDRWAVRRRIAADCASPAWTALIGEEIDAIAEAQLVQFQEQMQELDAASLSGIKASDWFARLPPAGFLDADGARRVDWRIFLGSQAPAVAVPLAPGDLRAVLAQALLRDPVPVPGSTHYRVYRIDDVKAQQWLFVRDAPNAPHAEEVWLDGERAGLPGISDVQTAIDTLRARCCRHLTLWPESDVHARIATIQAGADVVVCFEAGTYSLSKPVTLSGLGNVVIQGAGAGSLLRADAECALRVEHCASAAVSGLTVVAGKLGRGKDESGLGLRGALTVLDTPDVDIERVVARCARGEDPSAACIVVTYKQPATGSKVRIAGCDAKVGGGQIGIQCVNAETAIVFQNTVVASTSNAALLRGIVIGGQAATDVRIEDNIVSGVVQGISVGLSQKEQKQGKPLKTDRAVVANNSIDVVLDRKNGDRRRFGVFVGNANSVLVQANRVRLGLPGAAPIDWDAISLTGFYGSHLVVRDNHAEGATVGVNFTPLSGNTAPLPGKDTCVWLFQFNVAEGKGGTPPIAVKVTESVASIAIIENNIPPAS